MTEPNIFSSRALRAAYAMADTGKFEDVEAIKREMTAAGLGEEIGSLDRSDVRVVIDEVCATRRGVNGPIWHHDQAW
jgi:hypothetical protein